MKSFNEFLREAPEWLPYLKGNQNLDLDKFKDRKWEPVGKLWRGGVVGWLDDFQKMFGTVLLEAGMEITYKRPPYAAWSKHEDVARSLLKPRIM